MPADMNLIILYSSIFEHTRGYEKIVNINLKYNDINSILQNKKQQSCLEMFKIW